jgi:hypothetical protein
VNVTAGIETMMVVAVGVVIGIMVISGAGAARTAASSAEYIIR